MMALNATMPLNKKQHDTTVITNFNANCEYDTACASDVQLMEKFSKTRAHHIVAAVIDGEQPAPPGRQQHLDLLRPLLDEAHACVGHRVVALCRVGHDRLDALEALEEMQYTENMMSEELQLQCTPSRRTFTSFFARLLQQL